MQDPLYETISKVKQERALIAEACLNGVDTWEAYLKLVGKAQGLQETLDIIDSVLKEDEEEHGN